MKKITVTLTDEEWARLLRFCSLRERKLKDVVRELINTLEIGNDTKD